MDDPAQYIREAPVAMALLQGADARIDVVNRAFAEAVELSHEALTGRVLADLFVDRSAVAERLEAIRAGDPAPSALPVTRADGGSALLTAWRVDDGSDTLGVILTADSSEPDTGEEGVPAGSQLGDTLREVNEALLIAALEEQAEAEEARSESEAKSVFLASVSHELRTPLNSIIGYADLLQAGVPEALPEALTTHVDRIRSAGEHLLSLIEQIIEASRAEFDDRVDAERFDVARFLPEVLDLVRGRAERAGLELQLRRSTESLEVVADRRKIRQVLLNLLVNATKFTDEGYVRLELEHTASTFTLRVVDSGIGIGEDEREDIFRRFWQSGASAVRTEGGMGIGLWVVRTLVDAMGGEIELESEPGAGSTFTVTLPRSPARAPAGPD